MVTMRQLQPSGSVCCHMIEGLSSLYNCLYLFAGPTCDKAKLAACFQMTISPTISFRNVLEIKEYEN